MTIQYAIRHVDEHGESYHKFYVKHCRPRDRDMYLEEINLIEGGQMFPPVCLLGEEEDE